MAENKQIMLQCYYNEEVCTDSNYYRTVAINPFSTSLMNFIGRVDDTRRDVVYRIYRKISALV